MLTMEDGSKWSYHCFSDKGCGGDKYCLCSEDGSKYIIKIEKLEQTINDAFGYTVARELGFFSPKTIGVIIPEELRARYHIPYESLLACEYVEGIQPVKAYDLKKLPTKDRFLLMACVFLRQLLGNEDRMDIDWFRKAGQSGFVLDYGECFHKMDLDELTVQYSKKMLSVHYSEWILMGNLNSAVEMLINRCGIEESEVLDAEAWILLKLSQINLLAFRDFYQLITRCYSKNVCDLYRENIKMIKKSCSKIVKRYGIDETFDFVPGK